MTKSFVKTDPQNHNSENTWFTPKVFVETLGEFDLDPCTSINRPFDTAKNHYCLDGNQDGLSLPWEGRLFINPPYGKELCGFVERFINEKPKGVMLIFARMGSKEMQSILRSGAFVYLLRKRIHFVEKNGIKKTNAGTDSCLVFYDFYEIMNCNKFEGVLIQEYGNK